MLTTAFISALLLSAAAGTQFVNLASAQYSGNITIKADGSIDPATAPIFTNDNITYTLTENVYFNFSRYSVWCIGVERCNIVLDGSGHTIQGSRSGTGIEMSNPYGATEEESYNVTVRNFNVKGFDAGIFVYGYSENIMGGVVIAGNNVTANNFGIEFSSYNIYSNNIIIGNNITANNVGVRIAMANAGGKTLGNKITGNQIANNNHGLQFYWQSALYYFADVLNMNNTIFNNSFINNSQNVNNVIQPSFPPSPACANVYDNNGVGNYWSDYNGTDANNDGIGDTPYVIDGNNQDNYPLMAPYREPEVKETQPEPFPTVLVATASAATAAIIGVGLLVYFKKRNH